MPLRAAEQGNCAATLRFSGPVGGSGRQAGVSSTRLSAAGAALTPAAGTKGGTDAEAARAAADFWERGTAYKNQASKAPKSARLARLVAPLNP